MPDATDSAKVVSAAEDASFELPPEQEWLSSGDSREPIDEIYAALKVIWPVLNTLEGREKGALQVLGSAVEGAFVKEPGTRKKKDYARILSAATAFAQVYHEPRRHRHTPHDVRVLQLFTNWAYYVVEAFGDADPEWRVFRVIWPALREEIKEACDRVDDYVKRTKNGIADTEEDYYASYWIKVEETLDHLRIFLGPDLK
ncbi:unnamed protein product [Heligmosomoides polygyrus]|uniref:GLOBIN domain-containing protein n=1 Tax=Heligmosomoides polygyrus TaxID=6339 RepID=A0A183FK40_HELPZ|nr:unnamed protein product [Heligmosomoides polygyrus]